MDRGDLLFDLPPLEPGRRRPIHPASPRRQPIRNAILAYLTEPRTVKQIADRIGRRTSVATGHLRAMRAKTSSSASAGASASAGTNAQTHPIPQQSGALARQRTGCSNTSNNQKPSPTWNGSPAAKAPTSRPH
jgi:hypothetical protein